MKAVVPVRDVPDSKPKLCYQEKETDFIMDTITYTDQENRTYIYQIECLKGQDVLMTRPLWEEVFSEDSPAFTEYYFQKKAVLNTTFICRLLSAKSAEPSHDKDKKSTGERDSLPGGIISMVHLTPYEINIEGSICPSFYIVGVATKKSHRHRGLMAALLKRAFAYAKSLYCPFVFLMPADPAIYESFGFSYIYSRPQYDVPRIISQKEVYINSFPLGDIHIHCMEKTASDAELKQLSAFADSTLKEQFDYYLTRTPAYYETLLAELASQNGCIFIFTINGQIEGYFLYVQEEGTPFIQELLFSHKLNSYLQTLRSEQHTSTLSHQNMNSNGSGTDIDGNGTHINYNNGSVDIMSTYFPVEQPQKKPIIMARNLVSQHDNELSAACLSANVSVPDSLPISNYVNYLAHHHGLINEIV